MADTRCPICHSELTPEQTWTHDPICTLQGLAGDDYKKIQHIRKKDIEELQEARTEQEIDIGITEEERTTFTTVPETGIFTANKKHIRELRQSTEKILKEMGITNPGDEADLEQYFNYDEEGNYIGTYKYGEKVIDKTEWTRVDRNITGYNGEPYMPENMTHIYALDIEELRHPIQVAWVERWNITEPQIFESHNYTPEGVWNFEAWRYSFGDSNFINYEGDRGEWEINWSEGFHHYPTTINYPLFPPDPDSTTFQLNYRAIDDGSLESSKISIFHSVWTLYNPASPPQEGFAESGYSGSIIADNNITPKFNIKSTTRMSFSSIVNLSLTPGYHFTFHNYVYCMVRLIGTGYDKTIYYIYGLWDSFHNPPFSDYGIYLTQTEFQNFQRNIYEDFTVIETQNYY